MAPIVCSQTVSSSSSSYPIERINVKIRLWDESLDKSTMVSDSLFSIKTCSRIGIIFRIFATSVCTKTSSRFCVGLFKFSHNGKILYGDETPSELALCDGDVIDAVIDDLGGSQLV